jgi:hypothetical protein
MKAIVLAMPVVLLTYGTLPSQAQQTTTSPAASNQAKPLEDFSAFAGRWVADPPFVPKQGPKPRFVRVLEISVSPMEIRLNRGYRPIEVYRLDGATTDFTAEDTPGEWALRRDGEFLTGSLALIGQDALALTSRSSRAPGATTIYTDVYRIVDGALTMEGRRSQAQEDGSLVRMANTREFIVYRRSPG